MRKRIRKVRAMRKGFKGPKEIPFRKINRQGVAPASSFGVEIQELSDSEWLAHQRLMCSSDAPSHGGVSLSAR
eukprot:7859372-Pyramimonas_sp.AAC.1